MANVRFWRCIVTEKGILQYQSIFTGEAALGAKNRLEWSFFFLCFLRKCNHYPVLRVLHIKFHESLRRAGLPQFIVCFP